MAAGKNTQRKQILEFLDKLQPQFAKPLREGIDNIKSGVDLTQLSGWLATGRYSQAINFITKELVHSEMFALADTIDTAFQVGGKLAASFANAQGVSVRFNIVNPKTAEVLQSYKADLIKGISEDARNSIVQAVNFGLKNGFNPMKTARLMRDSIGLAPNQVQFALNYREELQRLKDPEYLARLAARPDVIPEANARELTSSASDRAVRNAINDNSPLTDSKIDDLVSDYTDNMIDYRSEMIARTESTRIMNESSKSMYDQAIADGDVGEEQVKRYWMYTHDNKTRDAHVGIPEINPDGVGQNEAFDSELGPIMYPGDPDADPGNTINCRCSIYTEVVPKAFDNPFSQEIQDLTDGE